MRLHRRIACPGSGPYPLGLSLLFAAALGLAFRGTALPADLANLSDSALTNQFGITSIVVEGTNLVLNAIIPPGLQQVSLETHPTLDGSWEEAGLLAVEAGAGEAAFTIPRPSAPVVFFRLKAKAVLDKTRLISGEVQFVTMPSLGSHLADNGDAIFHFKGVVDGSDKIRITRQGALWNHVNWDWPQGSVTINGSEWVPNQKSFLTTTGEAAFLPEPFSLESVQLEPMQGRDVVALERADNALIVYLDDTPLGADAYEFKIHFHPLTLKPGPASASTVATLKIAAQIDGSDCVKLTATDATWEHKAWSYPSRVDLERRSLGS